METIADISKKYLDGLSERFNIFYFKEFIKDLLNLTSDDIVNDKEYSPGTELYKTLLQSGPDFTGNFAPILSVI